MRLLRSVLAVLAAAVLAAGFLNTGTASAGNLGYSLTMVSHRCEVVFSGSSATGTIYEGVHCANLLAVRTSATSVSIRAEGEAYCQYRLASQTTMTVTFCDGIRQNIGLYTTGPRSLRGPVQVVCGDYGGSGCPAARYVHPISYYEVTSGCLTNVWSSMTNDALKRYGLSGTGNIASGHYEFCADGSYTALP